ncbi:HutD family protein [Enterobacteriaceae bacterium H11S18]|uniref:HutD/Ves family protein n=1 Tax=Dryocola clanedunensis TaxID=2925396 RepID=UPI0022EFEA33|nr:HutD family protein [Dryocola clanedunensis]MCT4712716.1 HutD family protein [Dryocola clanedunensis]
MIRLLPAKNHIEMPWKNGLGVTREVSRFPEAGEYDWRISLATIRDSGPFSSFPGYLRSISVLEGEGMYLTIEGERSPLIPPFQALNFNGESSVSCEIVGGPLLDFNVIYREAAMQATVTWCRSAEWDYQGGLRVLFNAGSAVRVQIAGQDYQLDRYDSLLVDEPGTLDVNSGSPEARLACITLLNK